MSDIKDHVIIPVKPLAVTVANGVALTAAAVATAGTAAAALIVGGVVVTGAAVKGAGKAKKASAARRSSTSTSATRKSAASSTGGKRATGKSGASSSGTGGGKAAGRGLLARMGKGKSSASGSSPKGTVYRSAAAKGSASSGPAKRGGGLGKVSPFRSSGKASAGTGPRSTSGASRSPLAKSAKWGKGKAANVAKRAVGLPLDKPTNKGDIRRAGFTKARGWFQRNVMGKKATPKRGGNAALKDVKPSTARKTVNGSLTGTPLTSLAPGAIIAGSMPQYLTSNAPYSTTHTAGGSMKHYAGQMADYAAEYDAPGVLEIIDELDANLYDSLKLVAEAVDMLSQKARNKWPFDQAIGQKLSMTSECLWAAAGMARDVVTDIESIHGDELRKLRNPDRPGMEKFDLAANGKA